MPITNLQVTENPVTGPEKLPLGRRYIVALTAGLRNGGRSEVPTTARGRALYTTDYFLNGKPQLVDHDNLQVSLRNGLAS